MKSVEIQKQVEEWAQERNFTAPYGILTGGSGMSLRTCISPYGILTGEHVNRKGRKYLSVTFGYARSLDATVEIYNNAFIIVRTSQHGSQVFKNVQDMQAFLDTL